MKLSVITPSFNSIRYIAQCLDSVRYVCRGLDYEHIVVDGLSNDGTLEYLQAQPDIDLIAEPDSGMYDALNKGVRLASGEIICHLNSDEQYSRLGFLNALKAFKSKDVDAVMSPTVMLDGQLRFMQLFNQIVKPTLLDVYWHMPVQSCSLLYRKALWTREPYSTKFRIVSDHVWFRKQMELGLKIHVEREPIGIFLWHGENLSSAKVGSQENALADIDRDSPTIRKAKRLYRIRKLMLGGYCRFHLRYEFIRLGHVISNIHFFPKLKIRKFNKSSRF
jgi:glycosyltransferase involved in cell wall biosynthesis